MEHPYGKSGFASCIAPIAVCISLFLFSACGSDIDTDTSADTGSIALKVVFQDPTTRDEVQKSESPSGNVCEDYLIDTIKADVYNSSGEVIASDSWECDTPGHKGTITNVPAGSGMSVIVEGMVSGNPDWQGRSRTISVSDGQNVDAGTVTMECFSSDKTPPIITSFKPNDTAADVPTNTSVMVKFSEDVVPACVMTAFALAGATAVQGTVTYDPLTWTATFRPDSDLDADTEYSVTFSNAVEDRAGNQMAGNSVSWAFRTGQVTDTESPTAPTLISATAVSDSEIDLAWEAASDNIGVTEYKIYRDGSLVKSVTNTAATDKNLSADTRYCYKVTALDGAENESAMSNERCGKTPPATTPPPSAPTLVAPQNGALLDNNCEDLSDSIEWYFVWSKVADASKYQIVVEVGGVSFIDAQPTSSSYRYSDPGKYVPDEQRFNGTWKVRAGNDQGQWSSWSEIRNFDVEPVNTDLVRDIRVPADQPTIQQGIDAAAEGSRVVVAPGAYNENIKMRSGVDVIADGPGASIVGNADISGVVEFSDCHNATLDGFEITVGVPETMVDRGVVFRGPLTDETAVLQNCFLYNTQYGIFVWSPATPTIQNNTLVAESDEQGIYIGNMATAPIIRNNIITGYSFAGIHVVDGTNAPTPVITHNNLWNNNQNYAKYPDQTQINGNISANPLFLSAGSHNYHLSAGSGCIDAGTSEEAPDQDIDREDRPKGGGYDIGADEF